MFYNNLDIIVSDFQNNDKRKFWKVIRHFVKNNKSSSCIPPLCSTLSNGDNQWHFNDQDKANCLNDYFASISTVNDAETQLPPFTKYHWKTCTKSAAGQLYHKEGSNINYHLCIM